MIYRVKYSSMTASYGPSFIEAESAYEAKRKFCNHGTFSQGEMSLMTATPVSSDDIRRALREMDDS